MYKSLEHLPKFIIEDISPIHATRINLLSDMFTNTVFPIRASIYDDEYHAFLKIDKSKIIAIEYILYYLVNNRSQFFLAEMKLLKSIILYLEQINSRMSIYDFSTNREIDRKRFLSLTI